MAVLRKNNLSRILSKRKILQPLWAENLFLHKKKNEYADDKKLSNELSFLQKKNKRQSKTKCTIKIMLS